MANVSSEQQLRDAVTAQDPSVSITDNFSVQDTISIDYALTIHSDGKVITWAGAAEGELFRIIQTGNLTMTDTILDGGGIAVSLIHAYLGHCTLGQGTILRNAASTPSISALYILGEYLLPASNTCVMDGALITGISGETAVQLSSATLIMQGAARIADNLALGVKTYHSALILRDDATISGNRAPQGPAGVLLSDTDLQMGDSASIRDNISFGGNGGGVRASNDTGLSTLALSGSASIAQNQATGTNAQGGGVFLDAGASLTLSDLAAIMGNTASGNGGGVSMPNEGAATLSGSSSITGNTSGEEGGGVYVGENATLTLGENAHIQGNTARTYGHGVRNLGAVHVSGSARVTDGLYFDSQEQAPILDGPLSDTAALTLEASHYVRPYNVPIIVLAGSATHPDPTQTDANAITLPDNFGSQHALVVDPLTHTIEIIELPSYEIRYARLHGSDNPNPTHYTANDLPYELLPPGPRDGYKFLGWVDAEGNPVTQIPAGAQGDMVLVAEWSDPPGEKGMLVFRANGPNVVGLPVPMLVELNQPVPLPAAKPSRRGFRFRCWNTMPDGAGQDCQPGGAVVLTLPYQDYFAQWISLLPPSPPPPPPPPVLRTLRFVGNAPCVCSLPQPITAPPGQTVVIPWQEPEKRCDWFLGWNTSPDGGGADYQPGQPFIMPPGGQALYAQWANC